MIQPNHPTTMSISNLSFRRSQRSKNDAQRSAHREVTAPRVLIGRWPRTIQTLRVAGLLVWAIFVALLILYHVARPEMATLYMRLGVVEGRSYWEPALLDWMFTLLVINLCICISGVGINWYIFRNRYELYNPSLLLMGPLCLFGFIVLWVIT